MEIQQQGSDIIGVFGAIGSVAAFFGLVFKISQLRKQRPKFKIDPRSTMSGPREENGVLHAVFIFNVYVKNQSAESNTLTNIHYVVWADPKKRTRTLSFGGNPASITVNPDTESGGRISLPISFGPNESKHLQIVFDVQLTGSHEESVFLATERTGNFEHQKHSYKLMFKDTRENLFDDIGNLRSEKLIQAWWMLSGTFEALKRLNVFPYFWHVLKIGFTYLGFQLRKVLYFFGF